MKRRSWLFTPGDSPEKMAKAEAAGADAVILDLEDAVAGTRKAAARIAAAAFLHERSGARNAALWVRINPLSSGLALADLAAVVPAAPDGIVLPKPDSAADVTTLAHYLSALEAAAGLSPGAIKILPIATETPKALLTMRSYGDSEADSRLAAITWGAEDLPAALGATANRDEAGRYTPVCELARALCLAAAGAAEVPPIDTVYPAFRDLEGLRIYAAAGRRDGFRGMLAIHPAQVSIINEVFSPTEAELDFARRLVALFDANPGYGALALDGKMVDAPHLKQARRLLTETDANDRFP